MNKSENKNTNEQKIIKDPPLLAFFGDIFQINNLCCSFWGEEGIYSDKYYYSAFKDNLSYIYKENNVIIAACIARYNHKTGFVSIDILCVKKEFQSRGYGKALLEFCLDNCEKNGFKYFELHVAKTNKKAIHLYKKYKFHIVRPIKNYYSKDKPPDNDAYYMQLNLNNIKKQNTNQNKFNKKIEEFKLEDESNVNKDTNINNNIYENYKNIHTKNDGYINQISDDKISKNNIDNNINNNINNIQHIFDDKTSQKIINNNNYDNTYKKI